MPAPDGRTEILMDPVAFLKRLASLPPAPYVNRVRYHGDFASRSKCRDRLPLPPVHESPEPSAEVTLPITDTDTADASADASASRPSR